MSEGPPTATSPTRTSKPPTPAPTTEAVSQDVSVRSKKAVKGQAVNGQKTSLVKRTYSQVVKDLDEDGFKLVMSKKEKKETRRVSSLGIRMPEGLKSVEEVPEWEVLEMAVDSGASESVVSDEMLTRVTTVKGDAMKKGVQYEVADGTLIPNLGEKKFIAASDNGVARQMRAQACEVNKALLSVHRVVQAGNRVVFAASGSYVQDERTENRWPSKEKEGVHVETLGESPGFQRARRDSVRPRSSGVVADTCASLASTTRLSPLGGGGRN